MSPDTLRIDRVIPSVGRIARASGTTDKRTYKAILAMLDTLYATGRLDLLRQLRDGVHAPMVLYDAFRRGALHELPTAETAGRLVPAMQAWVESLTDADAVPEHRRGLMVATRRLAKAMPTATIQQAADALAAVRKSYASQPRAFNLTRSALQAFLRDTLTKAHPVYHQVAAVPGRRVSPKRAKHPQTVAAMRALFPSPESDPLDAGAWAMALTGMGPGEYWGVWRAKADRVEIDGTKRKGRKRVVPLVQPVASPELSRRAWTERLWRRHGEAVKPYDFRRTYATWLEAAGVPRTRRRSYLGHQSGDVTDLYEWHDVATYLAADAGRIRAVVDARPTESPMVRLIKVGGGNA